VTVNYSLFTVLLVYKSQPWSFCPDSTDNSCLSLSFDAPTTLHQHCLPAPDWALLLSGTSCTNQTPLLLTSHWTTGSLLTYWHCSVLRASSSYVIAVLAPRVILRVLDSLCLADQVRESQHAQAGWSNYTANKLSSADVRAWRMLIKRDDDTRVEILSLRPYWIKYV
jgi:hypothetical protein